MTIFNTTGGDVIEVIEYAKSVLDDFKLIIWVIVGIGIGLWVLEAIVSVLRKK